MKKTGGALPVSMCKAWGEMMGMAGGSVRAPLHDLTHDEKAELWSELEPLLPRAIAPAAPARPEREAIYGRPHAPWLNGNSARDGRSGLSESGMMLLVSAQNKAEALEADRGGADIIDLKNLQEALVGSAHPSLVREVREIIPPHKHVSVTLGVVPNQPGTVAMAVHAAAMMDATSVKVGFQVADYDMAVEVLRESPRRHRQRRDQADRLAVRRQPALRGRPRPSPDGPAGHGRRVRRFPDRHSHQGRAEPVRLHAGTCVAGHG